MEPAFAHGQEPEPLAPVLVRFAGPGRQSRLSVFFRLILAIPHLIVLWALSIAAYVVVFLSWFAALFTGRLPGFAAGYLPGYLSWQTRVAGYLALLTGQYPPFTLAEFTLADDGYPIRVATRPGRLNRLAVLLRIFLLIPAAIVASLAGSGAVLGAIVSWLLTLILGQTPDMLHQALAAVVRYQTRYLGYTMMVTSTYPWGLFGDQPAPAAGTPAAGTPAAGTPAAEPAPAPAAQEAGETQDGTAWAAAEARDGYPAAPGRAGAWRLPLSTGARVLVGVFLVAGLAGQGSDWGYTASQAGSGNQRNTALTQLQDAYQPLGNAFDGEVSAVRACGGDLGCDTRYEARLAGKIGSFADRVDAISMPGDESAAARQLTASARKLAADYRTLSTATSAGQYQHLVAGMNLRADSTALVDNYNAIGNSLAS